jgi:hypothetical protein
MAPRSKIQLFTERDSEIEIKAGLSFAIELAGMGASGFLWTVADLPKFLRLTDEASGTPPVSHPPQTFTFEATAKGVGTLRFVLKRQYGPARIEQLREFAIRAT